MMLVICDNHHPRQVMELVKNGEVVDVSPIAQMDGDIYRCPTCGNKVITDFGEAHPKRNKTTENVKTTQNTNRRQGRSPSMP